MTDPDAPLARALRALQRLDEVTDLELSRYHLIEAETIIGETLGLTCTGEPSAWEIGDPERVTGYRHDDDTCPIHEWLVDDDQREVTR